jgi:1-aminocyclopropane-1-carboxylate deaminase/D-cysteine desulfhydrase-like pyridoxal-dependent ACC family enzyme
MQPLRFAQTPTPVGRIDGLCREGFDLWLKDDGASHALYGGNKVRKLEYILADALARNAKRLVTSGAAGSHQVLATALFGKQYGLPVVAVVCPQRRTLHAEAMLRATCASGARLVPVGSQPMVAIVTARTLRRGDYLVPPGASNVVGTLGYIDAVRELVEQIRSGALPDPDVIVVPLGSGGTAAGLLAGVVREGLRARILAVEVATHPGLGRAMVLALAHAALRRDGGASSFFALSRRLEVDGEYLGAGYGEPTAAGACAISAAAELGLKLEPTYTAKTFARVLAEQRSGVASGQWLYWHTLSGAPLAPLLAHATASLPQKISGLLK